MKCTNIKTVSFVENGAKLRLYVFAGLCKIGNQAPYFSITGEVYKGRRCETAGCLHEEILRHCPEYQPLVDLHLSDIAGVPMHAAANSNYFLQGGYWSTGKFIRITDHGGRPVAEEENIATAARLLRISMDEARQLHKAHLTFRLSPEGYRRGVAFMTLYCEAQKARWKAEAEQAIADFGLQVFTC